jgi:hypothetical protein
MRHYALAEREQPVRFLIRDHDGKFSNSFDAVFKAHGTRIIRTPVPEANGLAERFVRTARTECLDWLLLLNTRHLERRRELRTFRRAFLQTIGTREVFTLSDFGGRVNATKKSGLVGTALVYIVLVRGRQNGSPG